MPCGVFLKDLFLRPYRIECSCILSWLKGLGSLKRKVIVGTGFLTPLAYKSSFVTQANITTVNPSSTAKWTAVPNKPMNVTAGQTTTIIDHTSPTKTDKTRSSFNESTSQPQKAFSSPKTRANSTDHLISTTELSAPDQTSSTKEPSTKTTAKVTTTIESATQTSNQKPFVEEAATTFTSIVTFEPVQTPGQ